MRKSYIWYWLSGFILLLSGISLLYLNELFVTNQLSVEIINKLASAIIITGVFSLLNNLILRRSLVDLIRNKINLKQGIDEVGLFDVHTHIMDIDYRKMISQCKSNIDILHVYGRTWASNFESDIIEVLNKRNCSLRVILLDPDSKMIPGLAKYYGYSEAKLKNEIKEAKKTWEGVKNKVINKRSQKKVQIIYGDMFPAFSLYRFDDYIVRVDTRLCNSGKTKKLNSIICQKIDHNDSFYANYLQDLNNLVKFTTNNKV